MKGFFTALVFCASTSFFSATSLAQWAMPPTLSEYPAHVGGREDQWDRGWRPKPIPSREPRVIKKGLLAPSMDDRIALTTFLRDDKTGLIRLLPREVYDSESYRVDKKLKIPGGGAYYSFANLTHAYGEGSDIELHNNKLSAVFGGADYGMLTNISDAPLEQITFDNMRASQIAGYRPPRSQPEAQAEQQRLSSGEGMNFDGFLYQKALPVRENSTYLLRSIAYGTSDVLVAFRVTRRDTDGSVIIAWKFLKRYPTPKFKQTHRTNLPGPRTLPLATRR
jgi:hypothetical protein